MSKRKSKSITTPTARSRLKIRGEPYWGHVLAKGCHLGYRKRKSGGSWILRAPGDKNKTGSGRYRYRVLGEEIDLDFDAAVEAANKELKRIRIGMIGDVPTLKEACAEYVRSIRDGETAHRNPDATATDAEGRFRRLINDDPIGAKRLDKILPADVRTWWAGLNGSKASQNRNRASVIAAINYAIEFLNTTEDAIRPWRSTKRYREDERRELVLSREQRRNLLDACEQPLRDFVEAAMLTGCRPGDLTALRQRDFDPRSRLIRFRAKTAQAQVPLSDDAAVLFSRLARFKQPDEFLFVRDEARDHDGRQQPYRYPKDWTAPFKAAAQSALPTRIAKECTMYTLRHTFITEQLLAGMSIFDVARITRTSPAMIDKNYGHLVHDHVRDKLNAVSLL